MTLVQTVESNGPFEGKEGPDLSEIAALLRTEAPPAELAAAEEKLLELLEAKPADIEVLHLLGRVYMGLERYQDADKRLRQVLDLSPDRSQARWTLALASHYRNEWEEALRELEILLKREPDNSDYLNLKAESLLHIGEYDAALVCYEMLVSNHPTADNWMYFGHALKTRGRNEDCIAAYRSAIALKPDYWEAYSSLANLKSFRFTASDMSAMGEILRQPDLEPSARAAMHFALGKAYDDAKQYEPAFEHYREGNAVWRKQIRYSPEAMTGSVRQSRAVFTPEFFRERTGAGSPARDPIFVVSLPRSGSTLVEQILASHSAVEGTRELPVLNSLAEQLTRQARRAPYPQIMRLLGPRELRWAGEEYLARTRVHRKLGRPFFIDKMTTNFLHLGLIHLILPNAKIIDVRRHPLGCGLGNFKHFYLQGAGFSFDLAEIGRYYRDYVELMAHFDAVLPGRVHRVFYESLVAEPEQEIRKLLDYCALPFEEGCLRFYETERGIFTPSAEQVRQPIYTGAVEQWRRYEDWLGPLKAALGEVLACYPAVPKFEALPLRAGPQWQMSTQAQAVSPVRGGAPPQSQTHKP